MKLDERKIATTMTKNKNEPQNRTRLVVTFDVAILFFFDFTENRRRQYLIPSALERVKNLRILFRSVYFMCLYGVTRDENTGR